jgi:hypothetical protein
MRAVIHKVKNVQSEFLKMRATPSPRKRYYPEELFWDGRLLEVLKMCHSVFTADQLPSRLHQQLSE